MVGAGCWNPGPCIVNALTASSTSLFKYPELTRLCAVCCGFFPLCAAVLSIPKISSLTITYQRITDLKSICGFMVIQAHKNFLSLSLVKIHFSPNYCFELHKG